MLEIEGKLPPLNDDIMSSYNPISHKRTQLIKQQCVYISQRYPAFLALYKEVIIRVINHHEMKKEKLKIIYGIFY